MIHAHALVRQSRGSVQFIVRLRWALLIAAPFMFGLSTAGSSGNWMWLFLIILAMTNVALSVYARSPEFASNRWVWYLTFLCDLTLVTLLVWLRGGIRTDTYLLYVLLVGEAGILMSKREAMAIGAAAIGAYTAVILITDGPGHLDRIFIRTVYLGLAGLATTYLGASEKAALTAALTDTKTNLPNSRLFQEALTEAVGHHARQGLPLAVGIMDVDNFRQLNAEIGHPLADRVLEQLADLLLAWKQPDDVIARYGGEEFVFLLPGIDIPEAFARLDQLRERIAAERFEVGLQPPVRITISGGVSGLAQVRTVSGLLVAADRGLLEAKTAGKNRIVMA